MSDSTHKQETARALEITRRAERIRESVGCSWEAACDAAERDYMHAAALKRAYGPHATDPTGQ